jgi:hypothetical protein
LRILRRLLLPAGIVLSLSGCGEPDPQVVTEAEPDPVLELPGTLHRPDSAGFIPLETDALQGILLYLWIPLDNCDHNDPDLLFMAALAGEAVLPVPVQFDPVTRNAAQRRMNRLGLPLAVYLGDDSLLAFMDVEMLPLAVLVLPGGTVFRATGMGCAQRVLRDSR